MMSNAAGLDLQAAVDRFCALEQRAATISPSELYHSALSRLHDICSAVLRCEETGMQRDSIVAALAGARKIHSRSPFVRRLQDWPRGYPGDFETVAQIVRGAREAAQPTLEATCECHFIKGNSVLLAGKFPGPFDLVLAGGLFDYLETPHAIRLIRTIYHDKIRPGGTFFFTNIARGNPFRCLIEYMGDWRLIERSEEDVLALCHRARVPAEAVSIRTDETGLALLVDVTRPGTES